MLPLASPPTTWLERHGFDFDVERANGLIAEVVIGLPLWLLVFIFALLPARWILRGLKAEHDRRRYTCACCGIPLNERRRYCKDCRELLRASRSRLIRHWCRVLAEHASIVVLVLVVVFWIRSYCYTDSFVMWDQLKLAAIDRLRVVAGCEGSIVLWRIDDLDPEYSKELDVHDVGFGKESPIYFEEFEGLPSKSWSHFGINYGHIYLQPDSSSSINSTMIVVPYWLVCFVAMIFPCCAFVRRGHIVNKWYGGRNRCKFCGYDLRATPERCPECGRRANGQTAALPGAV
jgi:hypothetical protein